MNEPLLLIAALLWLLGALIGVGRFYFGPTSFQREVLTVAGMLFASVALCFLCCATVRKAYRCENCGSWKSRVEIESKTEWGENVGNILFMEPFYVHTERRICNSCSHSKVIKTWSSEVPDDESVSNGIKGDVLRHDFKRPGGWGER